MTINFITNLPPCNQSKKIYDLILVVMNHYTKITCYISIQKTINISELARILIQKLVLSRTDLVQLIKSNRSSVFIAKYWSMLCFYIKVHRRLSIAYHF